MRKISLKIILLSLSCASITYATAILKPKADVEYMKKMENFNNTKINKMFGSKQNNIKLKNTNSSMPFLNKKMNLEQKQMIQMFKKLKAKNKKEQQYE
jgi:hypothetical protein